VSYWEQYQRAGRNDMPALLFLAWINDEIDDEKVREELPHAYNAAEWPCRYIEPDIWVSALNRLGWVGDQEKPTEPMKVYRAQVGTEVIGLSWTPLRDTAEWFHSRNEMFGFEGRILEMEADPKHVLAAFEGREGIELLIDPAAWIEREGQPA
jgi:hypothetical protein